MAVNLKELVEKVNSSNLATVTNSIVKIIELINDPNSTAKQLKEFIVLDPFLSSKVIKLANSAMFGGTGRIADIQKAITWIGFGRIKEIVLSMQMNSLFKDEFQIENYSRKSLWKHSVSVAVTSRSIMKNIFSKSGDELYSLGLFHSIGLIIEDLFLNDIFVKMVRNTMFNDSEIEEEEMASLGFTNIELSKEILNSWKLPESAINSILFHHDLENCPQENLLNAEILYLANYLTQEADLDFFHDPEFYKEDVEAIIEKRKIKFDDLINLIPEIVEEIDHLEKEGWF